MARYNLFVPKVLLNTNQSAWIENLNIKIVYCTVGETHNTITWQFLNRRILTEKQHE